MNKLHKIILIIVLILVIGATFFNGGNHSIIKQLILAFIPLLGLSLFNLKLRNKQAITFLGLFLLFLVISSIFSASPNTSLEVAREYISLVFLFLIVISLNIRSKEKDLIIKSLVITGSIVSIVGLYFLATGGYHRLTSTFYWPNPAASYLILIIPLAFYWLAKNSRKMIPSLLTIILITSLILTASRGAWLSLLVVAIFFIISIRKRLTIKAFKLPLLILIISILLASGFIYIKTLAIDYTKADAHNTSVTARLHYYQGALNIFKDDPWLGAGLNSFSNLYPQHQTDPLHFSKYIHNWYLEILTESGMFALLTFLLFLFYILKQSTFRTGDKNLAISLALLAFLLHSLIDIGSHFLANQLLFWFLLGLVVSGEEIKIKKPIKIGILVLVIILFVFNLTSLIRTTYTNNSLKSLSKNKLRQAVVEQETAVNLSWLPQDNYYLANLYLKQDDLEATAKQIQLAIDKDPNEASNYNLAGSLALINKDIETAYDYFSLAQQLQPLSLRSNLNLMLVLSEQYNWREIKSIGKNIISHYDQETISTQEFIIINGQTSNNNLQNDWLLIQQLLDLAKKKTTINELEKSQQKW